MFIFIDVLVGRIGSVVVSYTHSEAMGLSWYLPSGGFIVLLSQNIFEIR